MVVLALKAKAPAKVVAQVARVKAAMPAKAMAQARAAVPAANKAAVRDKLLAMRLEAVARKAVAAVLAVAQAAAADRTRCPQTFRMAVTMTSSRANCAKRRCRNKILNCARNSGRSIAITRRARADGDL